MPPENASSKSHKPHSPQEKSPKQSIHQYHPLIFPSMTNLHSRPFPPFFTFQLPTSILRLLTRSTAHHSPIIHPLYPISLSISPLVSSLISLPTPFSPTFTFPSPISLFPSMQNFLKRCATLLLLASSLAGSMSQSRVLAGIGGGGGVGRE